MLNLEHYPAAIAHATQAVNELEKGLTALRHRLTASENAANAVAFDLTLKNDTQRATRRYELLAADDVYGDLTHQFDRLTHTKAEALARLELLRNEFTVAKLQCRQDIAQQLTSLEIRELVGV